MKVPLSFKTTKHYGFPLGETMFLPVGAVDIIDCILQVFYPLSFFFSINSLVSQTTQFDVKERI